MMIKNALLAGAAVAFLTAAPSLAQETPPAQDPAAAPAAPAASAQPQSLTLTPGTTVRGPDGELGKLEGVQNNAAGQQELTVRGADGQVRGVPLAGIRQEGADVAVAFTKAEYDAAAPVAGSTPAAPTATPAPAPAPAPAPTPGSTPAPTEPTTSDPATTEPADPSMSPDPMAPPAGETPTEPQ